MSGRGKGSGVIAIARAGVRFDAQLLARSLGQGLKAGARVRGRWRIEHWRRDGLLWVGEHDNIVVNQGLDDLLSITLAAGTQDTTWFVGLKGSGTPAAADTLASHATWSELTPYSGNRIAWTAGAVSGQSVSNSASPAAFAITSSATVVGAFLCGVNTGTSGRLYAVGNFAASRDVINGDTLNVTATFTSADDGV